MTRSCASPLIWLGLTTPPQSLHSHSMQQLSGVHFNWATLASTLNTKSSEDSIAAQGGHGTRGQHDIAVSDLSPQWVGTLHDTKLLFKCTLNIMLEVFRHVYYCSKLHLIDIVHVLCLLAADVHDPYWISDYRRVIMKFSFLGTEHIVSTCIFYNERCTASSLCKVYIPETTKI